MPRNPKQILEEANTAVAEGDYERLLTYCTDDTKWVFEGDRTLSGKAAVREYMAATYREPPEFTADRMIAEGDSVVAMGEITLKDEDGQATRYVYCDVWRFRGDKLAELHAFVTEPV
jgi:uncharacterized protein (TIGR02246 family)